ncbi:ATP-binding protein [Burkholderia gladioli]|uniref:ATP-binding protein n=1 Tax=Burkholderia gladioli TaxID=28095 RepID=UPI001641CAAE|nr:ATP-binding protein [Burkholderia gladioli]
MTTSRDLRELAVSGLLADGATDAGSNVFSPRTWATWDNTYPMLLVQTPNESGQGWGANGAPAFTVTTSLRVTARAQSAAKTDDAAAADVEEQLEVLREQIKKALINFPPIMTLIQQYPSFRSTINVSREGQLPIGELVFDLDLEFVQDACQFYPSASTPLEGIDVTVAMPEGTVAPAFSIPFEQPIS